MEIIKIPPKKKYIFTKIDIQGLKERIISSYPNWSEEKVNELIDYIQERLSDLKIIKLDNYLFFSKTNELKDTIFNYNLKNGYYDTYYYPFNSKFFNHFSVQYPEYQFIILNTLNEISDSKGKHVKVDTQQE